MAELIAIVVEAIANVVRALFELLPAIFEAVCYIAEGALLIVCLAISPRFRAKKVKEWQGKPVRKGFELGLSGLCLSALVFLVACLCWPEKRTTTHEKARPSFTMQFQRPQTKGTNTLAIELQTKQNRGGHRFVLQFSKQGTTNGPARE